MLAWLFGCIPAVGGSWLAHLQTAGCAVKTVSLWSMVALRACIWIALSSRSTVLRRGNIGGRHWQPVSASCAVQALQSQGCLSYRPLLPDGPTGARRMAQLPPDVDAGRISYVRVRCWVVRSSSSTTAVAGLTDECMLPGNCLSSLRHHPRTAFETAFDDDHKQADPEAFVSEVDAASADAVVMAGLLRRLARPAAFLEVVHTATRNPKF